MGEATLMDVGGGGMGGLGGGLVGGLLAGALFGNRGFGNFGYGNNCNGYGAINQQCATAQQLSDVQGSIIDSGQNTAVLQGIGDIKAAVPLAEAQVQLAVADATGQIRGHLGAVENTLVNGQTAINKNISDAIAASLASQNNININVLTQGSQTREAVATSTREILEALNAQNVANLQRQLTVAESALAEQRADNRARGTEVNVTQTVNQNQMQLQAQQQQQQQLIVLDRLCTLVGGLQNAVATNSNLIVGNTGAVATGPQTANPVNVRA